jgi:hypothetical protein
MKELFTQDQRMKQVLRLAYECGGYTWHDGQLVQIVSLEEVDDHVVVKLVAARVDDFGFAGRAITESRQRVAA